MELVLVLKSIYNAVGKGRSIARFFEDEMVGIIEQIGDVEYQSAVKALKDARISSQPSREIESAITCLRTAQHSYYSTPQQKIIFSNKKIALLYKKSMEASALLIACYHYLDESKLKASYVNLLGISYYYYTGYMDVTQLSFIEKHAAKFEPELQTALVEFLSALGVKEFWIPHPYHYSQGDLFPVLRDEHAPWHKKQIDVIATSKSRARWISCVPCGERRYNNDYGDGGQYSFLLRPAPGVRSLLE